MPRITIAQRLALLVAAVALVMTIAICLLSFLKGRAVLTDHEIVDLADETSLRMFEVREEFRSISREVRDSTAVLPKPPDDRTLDQLAGGPDFEAPWHAAFARVLSWGEAHGRQSPWSWVDRDIFVEAYYLGVDA